MALATISPFPFYVDRSGEPLNAGRVYFGTENDNPITDPIPIFWDADLTMPAANPVDVLNGYIVRSGTPALVYVADQYSVLVKDKKGTQVFYAPSSSAFDQAGMLLSELALVTGGGLIGFDKDTDYGGTPGEPSNVARALKEIIGTKVSTIYVDPTGDDANDGSLAAPFATLQGAINSLTGIGMVGGTRIISVAAGTYSTLAARSARIGPANASETVPNTNYQTGGIKTTNFIIVQGADVGYNPASNPEPVPTTIFDGGGAAAVGIQIEGARVLIRNIKFQNYSGSSSSAGILCDSSTVRTENVHADNCSYGISSFRGHLEQRGGVIENCTVAGTLSMQLNYHSIGNQGAGGVGQGPFFRSCPIGFLAQELATGHSDYATYEDCVDGIRCSVSARVNYSGSEFARCTRGVRVDSNAVTFGSGADFNNGTADACTENIVKEQSGGKDITADPYANTGSATDFNDAFDLTATATSTAILTRTIAQGAICPNVNSIRKPVQIKLSAYGTMTGVLDVKQLKIRLGTTILAGVTIGAAYEGPWTCEGTVTFTDSNAQSARLVVWLHGATAAAAGLQAVYLSVDSVGTEDIAAGAKTLTFEAQLGSAVADHVISPAGACHFELWG